MLFFFFFHNWYFSCLQEFPFFTLTSFPPAFLLHVGGVVSARSVKLLDRIHNPGEFLNTTNCGLVTQKHCLTLTESVSSLVIVEQLFFPPVCIFLLVWLL